VFSEAGKAKAKGGPSRTCRKSGSRDGLTIITSPSVESVMAGSAIDRRRDVVL